MSDVAQGEDWWLASDGKWYPPSSRFSLQPPSPPPPPPPPIGYRGPVWLSPTLTAWVRGLLWLCGAACGLVLLAAAASLSRFDQYVSAGIGRDYRALDDWLDVDATWGLFNLLLSGMSLVAGVVFIVWMYKAHMVTRTHRPVLRSWSTGWTIGAWFMPIANWVLPRVVLTEIERLATDIHVREPNQNWQRHRTASSGWVWWICLCLMSILSVATEYLMDRIDDMWMFDPGEVRTVYRVSIASMVFGVVAAVAGSRYVRMMGRLLNGQF